MKLKNLGFSCQSTIAHFILFLKIWLIIIVVGVVGVAAAANIYDALSIVSSMQSTWQIFPSYKSVVCCF